MAGQIILSNRLARMQQSMRDFGDTFEALGDKQRKMKLEDEDRKAAAEDRALRNRSLTAAAELGEMQTAEAKRREAERVKAQGFADELTGFGQAVPDTAIDAGNALPGMQRMQSPAPMVQSAEGLKDRIRASWMNAEARAKGETSAFTAADVKKKRDAEALAKDEALFDLGEKKSKAGRDASKAAQDIAESKAREANYYAGAAKDRKEVAAGKPLKLTEKQTATLGAAGMAKTMLDDLAKQFTESNLGGGKGFAADVVESIPVVGGKLAPKTAEFNDKRRIIAETFLREATGAAAPKEEVKFYTRLLPEPGDSPKQAQSALEAFRMAVKAKSQGVAESLRAQGHEDQAIQIEQKITDLFADAVNIPGAAGKLAPGATKKNSHGDTIRWNGQAWELAG